MPMSKRMKSALVVFIGLAIAFVVVGVFDYTHDYVGNRFKEAMESGRYEEGQTFSLDAFMEFYDWDSVCVALPGDQRSFRTRAGTAYKRKATVGQTWSLVFVKQDFVVAEIPFDRSVLAYPNDLEEYCFARWQAVFSIARGEDGIPRLTLPGP